MEVDFVKVSLELARLFDEAGLKHRPRISIRCDTEEDAARLRSHLRTQFLKVHLGLPTQPTMRDFYTAGIKYELS